MTRPWTRRAALAALTALPAARALPQAAPFAAAMDSARAAGQLRALVIAHRGRIIEAEAFRGPALDVPVNVKSVSKTLVSALTGIAIQRGELTGTDQRVAPLLRRWVPRWADPRVRQITVADMLTMRSGLQVVSGEAYGSWVNERHWIYEALSKPMVADPGTAMLYSTASYHILGAMLSQVSGRDLHDLTQTRIGDKLGIDLPRWSRDPHGRYVGGNDMRLSPLAMLRFGETYRRGGAWQGAQVVPPGWVATSWIARTASVETGHGYGYGWYVWQAAGQDVFYARGYGGQMIYIVPALELTVAITSDPGRPATLDGHLGALNRIFAADIVPAARSMP